MESHTHWPSMTKDRFSPGVLAQMDSWDSTTLRNVCVYLGKFSTVLVLRSMDYLYLCNPPWTHACECKSIYIIRMHDEDLILFKQKIAEAVIVSSQFIMAPNWPCYMTNASDVEFCEVTRLYGCFVV